MEIEESWIKFTKSGKIEDYLHYTNSIKEKQSSEFNKHTVHGTGFSNKRDASRGE